MSFFIFEKEVGNGVDINVSSLYFVYNDVMVGKFFIFSYDNW